MALDCHMKEFCPTYYKHGDTKCEEMLKLDRCGIRKARLYTDRGESSGKSKC